MEATPYKAEDLFEWVTQAGEEFLLLDVRVNEQFDRFKVEGPFLSDMVNVPYVEFVEHEEESVARVPAAEKVRIVCAKEGSARYVGEILVNHGFKMFATLKAESKPGAICWRQNWWYLMTVINSISLSVRERPPAVTD